ncbi:hypothetical protein [Pseudoclavibacter sp. AY1H1]|uniref:hypothetical protein n=1 Tax=Pseudoclavibacter sp. AY1H1 TaxID=2080584 RepID=UPI000CE8A3B8|nr:hypothetical protein [Pseudoclavibacter sp. AY1H1]PPF39987.1 hypothetical protein C5E05_01880 [Pseudoclavibacter sp. AY1H1]
MTARVSFGRWAWRELSIHPYLKALYLLVYLTAILLGLAALIAPPASIEVEIGPALTVAWGWLSLLAGVVGASAVLPGWWWAEKFSCGLLLMGLAIYLGTVIYVQNTSSGNRWAQMTLFSFGILLAVFRIIQTWKYAYEPRPKLR